MKLKGKYNHEVLHKLGAVNVSSNNTETIVEPDIDISNYENIFNQVLRDNKLIKMKTKRNELLKNSDIYCLVDNYNKLTASQKTEIETYRQALKDLPTIVNVDNPVYPNKPVWAE